MWLYFVDAQAVTFRTEADMITAASKLSLGVLAFVMLPSESLYVRIDEGFREILVSFSYWKHPCLGPVV